jgi:hypothetical protein
MRTCLTRAQGIKNLSVFLNLIIIAITCLHSTANGVSAQGLASNLGASLHESERAGRVRELNNSSFTDKCSRLAQWFVLPETTWTFVEVCH